MGLQASFILPKPVLSDFAKLVNANNLAVFGSKNYRKFFVTGLVFVSTKPQKCHKPDCRVGPLDGLENIAVAQREGLIKAY